MAKSTSKLQKLTEEELTQINSIRNEASQIFFELGRIAIRRRNSNLQIDNDEEKLENQLHKKVNILEINLAQII